MGVVFNAFAWAVIFGALGACVGQISHGHFGIGLVGGLIIGSLVGIYSHE